MNYFFIKKTMNLNKKITIIIISFLVITGCASVKKTLSGTKKQNSDEFLVQKKNPLVLPPNFNDLPKPEKAIIEDSDKNKDIDFSGVLSKPKDKKKIITKKNSELEKSLSKILNSN
tara:strand:+ start:531 stop:878 length:348 start_codon:yes stop_codon:yes gene_type:complete